MNISSPSRSRLLTGTAIALSAVLLAACNPSAPSSSENGDSKTVRIGVGGQPVLAYLPTTLGEELGFYEDAGVDVDIQDLQAGSDALQAMMGGSTDVTSGYYDHTIQMAAQGQEVRAFVNLLRYPAIVIAVAPDAAGEIKEIADLEGKTVGVTAPGGSTDFFLKHMLTREGLEPDAAAVSAVGADATAVAAMEQGQVDAAVMLDPAFSQLEARVGGLTVLADTRTEAGVEEIFGTTTYPAAVFYAKQDWIDANEDTTKKLAAVMQRTLQWIQDHTAEEIAAEMPKQYAGDDPALYTKAIAALKDAYNPTGELDEEGANAVLGVMAETQPEVADADVDVSKTFTNEFLDK